MRPYGRGAIAGLGLALALSTPAGAGVTHTVRPGETMWAIATAQNLTTRALAAANGLPETAQVIAGTSLTIPTAAEAASALGGAGGSGDGQAPTASTYTVRPGDTLLGIAAAQGVDLDQLAALNGLASDAQVLSGAVLRLPGPGGGEAPVSAPASARVSAQQIGEVAIAHGVSPSLAAALAWQESGFNNNMVSSAQARGVMQVMPGTWSWLEDNLALRQLVPSLPDENIHAGVLYLGELISNAGGDERLAVAGYYQGPGSVQADGVLPETQRYVDNVMALRSRFGG